MATGEWPGDGAEIKARRLANDPGDGSINEQSLALSWQIPRTALATIRKSRLREHWHWKYGPSKNHGDVRITLEGIAELKKWVLPPDRVVPLAAPEQVLVPVAPGEVVPLGEDLAIVTRIPPNPRLLVARGPHGDSVSIRVNSNRNFKAGMKIDLGVQCVRLALHHNQYYVVYAFKGKYPRSYGRW